jgi:hypothetical protein
MEMVPYLKAVCKPLFKVNKREGQRASSNSRWWDFCAARAATSAPALRGGESRNQG